METADAAAFAAAMQEGVAAAYKAVMKPAEGTVLTVSRLAAKRAVDTAAEGADVETTLAAAIEEGYDALAQTTDMNPVLKKAGVVDAGGKGYLLILEGMLAELRGEPSPKMWRSLRRTRKRPTSTPWRRRRSPSPSTPCSLSAKPLPTRGLRPLRPI